MLSERELQQVWYGGREPPWHLRVLAVVYAGLMRLRRGLYSVGLLPRVRLPVPVVVVGNVTAGGTGKTPLVIALIEALRARGLRPGVISRGYGGSAVRPSQVTADSGPDLVGDEACLIFRATGAPVSVGRDRVAAGGLLLATGLVDVLIADDGLQHYKLCPDVEICVIDGDRRFGNGRLLPAGPLREPVERLQGIDFRICNGAGTGPGEVAMALAGDEAVALTDTTLRRRLADFSGKRVHAVAGIGNPSRFFAGLRATGIETVEHAFDDHHAFVAADLEFGDGLPVLMTEKDAVKCERFADARLWSVPVRAVLPDGFFDALAARVRRG